MRILIGDDDPPAGLILRTALEGRGHYLEAMRAGADDFINKPAHSEELEARLVVADRILGLQAEVKDARNPPSICSCCKMIRDTEGKWHELSQYIADRANTEFTHGICSPCFRQHIDPMLVEGDEPRFGVS
jgi:YesN/AraC family two-component response regulator